MGGLYRGFTISAVGIFIYRGMYFGMFDTLKPMLIGGKDASVAASFPSRMGCDRWCWPDVLPHWHRQEEDDDDLRRWSQVQGFHRLRHASHQGRRLHEPDEGRRS